MGPVEQGLLECAANGTLSPEGRVSPLVQICKTPDSPRNCVSNLPNCTNQAQAQGCGLPVTSILES